MIKKRNKLLYYIPLMILMCVFIGLTIIIIGGLIFKIKEIGVEHVTIEQWLIFSLIFLGGLVPLAPVFVFLTLILEDWREEEDE